MALLETNYLVDHAIEKGITIDKSNVDLWFKVRIEIKRTMKAIGDKNSLVYIALDHQQMAIKRLLNKTNIVV